MKIRLTLLLFSIGFIAQSCGDVKTTCDPIATTGATITKASLSSIQTTVFDKQCATAGCHDVGGDSPLLTAGKSYAELINGTSQNNGSLLVKANDPLQSYLMVKILNSDNSGLMPKGGSKLPQNVIDSISAWIAKGAPND